MESAGSAGKGCGDAAYKDGIPSGNRKLNAGIGKTGKIGIRWNDIPCPMPKREETGWFTDSFIRTVSVPGLKKGENELLLEVPFGQKTNLENLFLLGEFGVCVLGTKAW